MIQIVNQTDKQKMVMYMKLPKRKIINMLIQCNKIFDTEYRKSSVERQDKIMKDKNSKWLQSLLKQLVDTLRNIGNKFNIIVK